MMSSARLAPRRRSHVHQRCMYQRDLGVPFVSFKYPDRASLQRPRGLRQVCSDPATGAGTGFGRLSGRCALAPSGDWDSGNPAFAISRGSPGAPLSTPGHDRRFPGMLFSPSTLSDHGSAIRSRDISSRPCPLRERYNAAPRGAATTITGRTAHWGRLLPRDHFHAVHQPSPARSNDATASVGSSMSIRRSRDMRSFWAPTGSVGPVQTWAGCQAASC